MLVLWLAFTFGLSACCPGIVCPYTCRAEEDAEASDSSLGEDADVMVDATVIISDAGLHDAIIHLDGSGEDSDPIQDAIIACHANEDCPMGHICHRDECIIWQWRSE